MNSKKLLNLLNDINTPDQILIKLSEENFAISDLTKDGDSVLHVLARSKHSKTPDFFDYIQPLIEAGAPLNVNNKQGNSFLYDYLEQKPLSIYEKKILDLLLKNKNFDPNQYIKADQTLFEFIYNSSDFGIKSSLKNLIKHEHFNPNQKTSIPNNGKTVLAQILSTTTSPDMELIKELTSHKEFDVHALDKDGNNYLQLAVIYCEESIAEIAVLLKNIDILHKNNEGKAVIELILENKAYRYRL